MFKHGHFKDACVLFFPPNVVPSPPQPSSLGLVTSSSSPQRPDPLVTDYGIIDDLCDLCVAYGAMPVLEEVLSSRMSSAASQDVSVHQHTVAALARIYIYCETHKHFNFLYHFQVDVKSFHDTDGSQWKHSLFGNPNDPETFRRRCEIAETLVEKNFDLAFQVIYEFTLPAVDIYAGVAASLAERKKGGQLTEFFRNIKGTIEDDEWDQVLGAAINVYANKHKERPDRLIDMLTSSHRKVLACVVCGRLKSAFQIASRSGSVADVQYVAHQALHANALPVLDMCKQWLAQYM